MSHDEVDWGPLADIVFQDKATLQGEKPTTSKRRLNPNSKGIPIYVYDHEKELSQPPEPIPFDPNRARKNRNRAVS